MGAGPDWVDKQRDLRASGAAEAASFYTPAQPLAPPDGSIDPEWVVAKFYDEEYPQIVAAIALVANDLNVAYDAVDEAVAECWQDGDAEHGVAMFASAVRSQALANARQGKRRRLLERRSRQRMRGDAAGQPGAVDDVLAIDVRRVLATLSRRQREVAVLHFMFDMRVEDIATELGVSESTVKTMLRRARNVLMNRLAVDAAYDDESSEEDW